MFLSHARSKVSKIKISQPTAPETRFGKGRSNTEQMLSGLDPVSFALPEYWQFCICLKQKVQELTRTYDVRRSLL
jgi:hypothetical protein